MNFEDLKERIDEKLGFSLNRAFDTDEDYAKFIDNIIIEHFENINN